MGQRTGKLLLSCVLCLTAIGGARADRGLSETVVLQQRLDSLVAGAAGVAVAGVVVVRSGANGEQLVATSGCARFETGGKLCRRPLSGDQLLRVASISKLFVAVAIHRLVESATLRLDDDVSRHLGYELRNPDYVQHPITIAHLLSHTSSLRDGERYWIAHPGTLAVLLADADRFDPLAAPGKHYEYANINYGVLAAVLERVSGAPFDQYMTRSLFGPAKLLAGFNWSGVEELPADMTATLYRRRAVDTEQWQPSGSWVPQVDEFDASPRTSPPPASYVPGSNPTLFSPQGGLRISASGVADFVRHTFVADRGQAALLGPASRRGLCRPMTGPFGLGAESKRLAGRRWCGHFAEAYGLKGGALFDSRRRETLVYFITGYGDEPPLTGSPYAGLDRVEAAVIDAALAAHLP